MTTQNTFVRKFDNYAVLITVTDWEDYQELMQHANPENENPDFLVASSTSRTIYSNMNPSTVLAIHTAQDITEETQGVGLSGIITGGSRMGPLWAFKKIKDPLLGGLISEEKDIKLSNNEKKV